MYKANMIAKRGIFFLLSYLLLCSHLYAAQGLAPSDVIRQFSVDGNTLKVVTSSGQYNFPEILNSSATVRQKNERTLIVGYNYWASRTKSLQFAELLIKKGKLTPVRIDTYMFDNPGQRSFGCSTLFDMNKEGIDVTSDSVVTMGSICSNYDFVPNKEVVTIATKKGTIEASLVSKQSNSAVIPVFYSDGTLIGRLKIVGLNDPSDLLGFSIQNNATFEGIDLSRKTVVEKNNIGYFLERAGKYDEAISILTQVVNLAPGRTVAYLNLGDSYAGHGDMQSAKDNYRIYIDHMKAAGKTEKIPQRVLEAVSEDVP